MCVPSVDCFQSGKEPRAMLQDGINPMKAAQKNPREEAGRRASTQILGDAIASGLAGQSHMAPGQTRRRSNHLFSHVAIPTSYLAPSVFCRPGQ